MSEYIKLDGERYFLGTCTDITQGFSYEEFKQLAAEGRLEHVPGNDTVEGYLNPQHCYIYRFPVPKDFFYKNESITSICMNVPEQFILEREHKKVQTTLQADKNKYVRTVAIIECPQSKGRGYTLLNNSPYSKAQILGETFICGKLVTLFECPFCEKTFYFTDKEIAEIRDIQMQLLEIDEEERLTPREKGWLEILDRLKGIPTESTEEDEMAEQYLVTYEAAGYYFSEMKTVYSILEILENEDCMPINETKVYKVTREGVFPLTIMGKHHNPKDPLYVKVTDSLGNIEFDGYVASH